MVMDASNIAVLGSAAATGYQAPRLGGVGGVPGETDGTTESAAPIQLPVQVQGGVEPKAADPRTRDPRARGGSPESSKDQDSSSDGKLRKQVHMTPIFRFDGDSQRIVMLSRDMNSGDVLFQIPSEEALRQYEQSLKRQKSEPLPSSGVEAVGTGSDIGQKIVPGYTSRGRAVGGISAGAGHASGVRFSVVV